MNALTFPRVVADRDGNGWPYFALKPAVPGEPVLWWATPTLPDGYAWADESDPIDCKYTVLDEDALTELLYTAPLSRGKHSRTELTEAVEGRLYACRCRVEERPDHNAPLWRAECRAWARELLAVAQ